MVKKDMLSLLVCIVLGACQVKPTPTSTPTLPASQSATHTMLPPTQTPIPTREPFPTPTISPTPQRPQLAPITAENIQSVREEALLGDGRLADIAGSEAAGMIAYASNIGIRLLDSRTMAEKFYLESTIPVACIEFAPDGSILAAGYESGLIRLYSVQNLLNGETST